MVDIPIIVKPEGETDNSGSENATESVRVRKLDEAKPDDTKNSGQADPQFKMRDAEKEESVSKQAALEAKLEQANPALDIAAQQEQAAQAQMARAQEMHAMHVETVSRTAPDLAAAMVGVAGLRELLAASGISGGQHIDDRHSAQLSGQAVGAVTREVGRSVVV